MLRKLASYVNVLRGIRRAGGARHAMRTIASVLDAAATFGADAARRGVQRGAQPSCRCASCSMVYAANAFYHLIVDVEIEDPGFARAFVTTMATEATERKTRDYGGN